MKGEIKISIIIFGDFNIFPLIIDRNGHKLCSDIEDMNNTVKQQNIQLLIANAICFAV